ncbi:MAG TPA: DUF5676 family membrane protein [Xanthomonadaceae bacterium]|nr:DUF5676 family membrane protein [Xanthomonadaceae bacterium]
MTSRTENPGMGAFDRHAVSPRLRISVVGWALSTFLLLSFLLCVAGYLAFPRLPIAHSALSLVLPGFTLLDWTSFCLGLVESFAWGWYIAVGFGLLYNFFASQAAATGD